MRLSLGELSQDMIKTYKRKYNEADNKNMDVHGHPDRVYTGYAPGGL